MNMILYNRNYNNRDYTPVSAVGAPVKKQQSSLQRMTQVFLLKKTRKTGNGFMPDNRREDSFTWRIHAGCSMGPSGHQADMPEEELKKDW